MMDSLLSTSLTFSHLDLDKVRSIEKNRLIAMFNHFTVSFVKQCNEMQYMVDSRLTDINKKINMCESNLLILETKFASIAGLSSEVKVGNSSINTVNSDLKGVTESTTGSDGS